MNDSNSPATDEITGLPTMAEANPIPTKVMETVVPSTEQLVIRTIRLMIQETVKEMLPDIVQAVVTDLQGGGNLNDMIVDACEAMVDIRMESAFEGPQFCNAVEEVVSGLDVEVTIGNGYRCRR